MSLQSADKDFGVLYEEDWEEDNDEEGEEEDVAVAATAATTPSPEPLKPPYDESGRDYRLAWLKRQLCLYLNLLDPDVAEEQIANPQVSGAFLEFLNNDLGSMSTEEGDKMRTAYFFKMKVEGEDLLQDFGEDEMEAEEEAPLFDETTDTEKKGKKKKKGKGKKEKGAKGKGGGKKKEKSSGSKDKSSSKSKSKSGKDKSKSGGGSKKEKGAKGEKGKKGKKGKKKKKGDTTAESDANTPIVYPWDEDTDLDVESLPEDKNRYYLEFSPYRLPQHLGKLHPPGLYFIRMSRIPVPQMRSMKEAERDMPKHLMFGNLHGFQLRPIISVLKTLFHPLVELSDLDAPQRRLSQTKMDIQPLSDTQKNQLKSELELELRKFLGTLNRAVDYLESEIKLKIPVIPELEGANPNIKFLAKLKPFVSNLETVCRDWEQRIANILERELPTQPKHFTPLSELEFWRDRNSACSAIFDQLQCREVKRVCQVLSIANSDLLPGFEYQQQELLRSLQEARDVSRFLSTIERHLKTLTYSNSFFEMTDAIPHIMEGLQLVWMLSRYYNKDERMCGMLEKIAKLLYDRTTASLHPRNLFRKDPVAALDVADSIRVLLTSWKECYMDTRQKIEMAGKGARWDFDKSKLFPKTDYVCVIAQHLSEVAILLTEFQNFFGPEIKAVVGDPRKIEEALKRAFALAKPFIDVKFDPFLQANQKLWTELLDSLKKEVQVLEIEAKSFIDEAFVTIKSADAAFEMLMKFKFIETREGIHQKLMKKFDDTLMIYILEVRNVKEFFDLNRDNPPILKYNPPVAGRIWWVRALFYYIKKSIVTFRTQPDVIGTDVGQQACREYLALAREMKAYEDSWYIHWTDISNQTMGTSLRKRVFVRVPAHKELGPLTDQNKDKKVIKVNLAPEVMEMVQEAIHLEQMGYRISEGVRNVSLLRETLMSNARQLQLILDHYYAVRRRLRSHEADFMEKCIVNLEKSFDQGLLRVNWTALGIPDYAKALSTVIQTFDGTVSQVNRVAKDVRARVLEIKTHRLFKEPPYKKSPISLPILDCWDYFQYWDSCRNSTWERLLLLYRGLASLFIKLENLAYGKTTGKMKKFRKYYAYWEMCVFRFLSKVVIRSLYEFEIRMTKNDPLFDVEAVLTQPEIRITPSAHEIFSLIAQATRQCVEGTKRFIRWRRGSCIEVTPIKQPEENEPFLYSYFHDIGRLPRVLEQLLQIQENIMSILRNIWSYLKKYQSFKNLWLYNKEKTLEMFAQKNPPVSAYDSKMSFYSNIISRLYDLPPYRVEGCIRINVRPLQHGIAKIAREWVLKLGDFLLASTKELKGEFDKMVLDFEKNLHITPRSQGELKHVFLTIQRVQANTIEMEGRYRDLCKRYAVLLAYDIDVPDDDLMMLENSWKRWQTLWLYEVKVVLKRMEPVKLKFKKITMEDRNKFRIEVQAFVKRYFAHGPGTAGNDLEKGLELLEKYKNEYKKMMVKKEEMSNLEKLFGLDFTSYPELIEVSRDLENLEQLYQLYIDQREARARWSSTLWVNLNPQALVDGIDEYIRTFRAFPKVVRDCAIAKHVEEKMKEFKRSVPLFVDLKHEALRPRHWTMLMNKTGVHFDMDPEKFTLGKLFAMELHQYSTTIAEIIATAVKESQIEKTLKELTEAWDTNKLILIKYIKNDEDRGWIVGPVEDMMQVLDDNLVSLQGISGSRFVGPFYGEVTALEKTLSTISEVMENWIVTQRKWSYLEGIFAGRDIRQQLAEEARRFDVIDETFRTIMAEALKKPFVKHNCLMPNRLNEFKMLIEGLDRCQKSLNEYLEAKRNAFARFYFISDDELLSILGQGVPKCVQEHMIKMFDNVAALKLVEVGDGEIQVHAMISAEKEVMDFRNIVPCKGRIEEWMNDVVAEMRVTNKYITKKAIFFYGKMLKTRVEWMLDFQGMVVLAANQVWWTAEVEDVFYRIKLGEKRAMKEYLEFSNKQLDDLVVAVRSDLSSNDRKKYNTSLIIDVHARDIIETFVRDSIMDEQEFEWESQLRFYWIKAVDGLVVKQCTGSFDYGYEYMGLNGRLVITPLTDRIYLTITQALSFFLGGAPAGPAGTGKTETTKDLAKALGLLCVVTNCGENMDYKAVGTIFAGLCICGAWGCFDEFNRIDISVLSVISSQIQTIRNALMTKLTLFEFDGQEIKLDSKVGIFITMNPGYAGRTELPESVKALFRPVVCIVPDLEMICQIMLFSEGFLQAKVLAKKMTVLYKLAKGQLSKQHHYDFGLRALKSVLVMAGDLKRSAPDLNEELVLMRALRDMNLPKFVFEDVPLFLGLIQDLFPGLDCPRVRYPDFNQAVEDTLQEKEMIVVADQVDKVVQFYETMMTRWSTMLVGPTGGGKSVVINTLCKAQGRLGIPTTTYVLNPKAISVNELYGVLNPATRDWTDGLLSNIFREINRPTEKVERRYIVFDGDVDALWIENMNSVMDDNKLLTLPNGERIRLQKHCALLFEVGDLQYASPATVSRAGMVFVDPKNLGYDPFWMRWVSQRNPVEHDELHSLFQKYVPKLIALILEGIRNDNQGQKLKMIIPQTNLNMVTQLANTLTSILPEKNGPDTEMFFLVGLYWSLGATLIEDSREIFDSYCRELSTLNQISDTEQNAKSGEMPTAHGLMYEYTWMAETRDWRLWKSLVPPYQYNPKLTFSQILVPTVDTEKTTWVLKVMDKIRRPTVLIGETGTSKTATTQAYVYGLSTDTNIVLNMNFSSRTSSMDVQRNIESSVEKWTKEAYGPTPGKRLLIFIDDMNMPQVDTYGTQQPIALLKLLVDKGGLYDRGKDLNWKFIKEVCYVAAMGKAGGGRNEVDSRFMSLFSAYNMTFPSKAVLKHIFTSIFNAHVVHYEFPEAIQDLVRPIVAACLELFKTVIKELPPTPACFHYIFNMRDLSRVFAGLCQITPETFYLDKHLVRVWRNECSRIFCDRLINKKHIHQVNEFIEEIIEDKFEASADYALKNPLLYGDYRNAMEEDANRIYEDILDYDTCKALFQELLENYNETNSTKMQLVLFNDALEHATRIHRAIRMHKGHCLLVGVGGSGRQSLTKLATHTAGYKIFEIALSRGYGDYHFREDLKKLYNELGIANKATTFLFSDTQIAEEGFLELINNMLTAGIVPALFTEEERENILATVREEAKKNVGAVIKETVWQYFIAKCIGNLHIVLAMSPTGEALRTRCRNFPGLVNNTYIDWFQPWPKQALFAVATVFFSQAQVIPAEHVKNIVKHVVHVHNSVQTYSTEFMLKLRRCNYVSPKHFLDYQETYVELFQDRLAYITALCKRLQDGIKKIADAKVEIEALNTKLVKSKKIMDEKTQACEVLLTAIVSRTEEATEKKEIAIEKGKEIEAQSEIIQREKQEAESVLEQALPALEAARLALQELDKNDIVEIRSFATPPKAVQIVCECVMALKGIKETGWKAAKGMMAEQNFLKSVMELDVDSITQSTHKRVHDMLEQANKTMNMTVEGVRSVSRAAAGLLKFVDAVMGFCIVNFEVKPKRDLVNKLMATYNKARNELDKTNARVAKLEEELGSLQKKYDDAMQDKQILEDKYNILMGRLNNADRLITGLSSENERWGKDLGMLKKRSKWLLGDCLISAAFLTYTGAFSWDYRKQMIYEDWLINLDEMELPRNPEFRVEDILTDDVEVSKWSSQGLPNDELSVQNGILTTKSKKFALCIDPQQQAAEWIKNREADNKLILVTFTDYDMVKQLTFALQNGLPMLYQDVEEYIDPIIDNVLDKSYKEHKGKLFVVLGDREIEVNPDFRLYMNSKLSNPKYSPGVFAKAMVINYTVTVQGLEGQLLGVVVAQERPDLEEQRNAIIHETSKNKSLLKDLEDMLLRELSQSQGSMVDNVKLVNAVDETKFKADEVSKKLALGARTAKTIERLRGGYRPAATRGAILFFVLSDMSQVSPMYQYSLSSYLGVFTYSLKKALPDAILKKRLRNIINTLTVNVYDYGCTGIFEKHKLLYSLQIAVRLEESGGNLTQKQLEFFIKGNVSVDKSDKINPFGWLPGKSWEDIVKLIEDFPDPFADLLNEMKSDPSKWKEWYDSDQPESLFPMPYEEEMGNFHCLMLLRCFRVDRVYRGIVQYISEVMDERFVTPPVISLDAIYDQASVSMPVIFILSPGSEPSSDIQKLGERVGVELEHIKFISLGQGQETAAMNLLKMCSEKGYWLILQNCHLLLRFVREFEKSLEKMGKPHPEFRLWMTTDPTPSFPIGLLQKSLKVVTEPPNGLKLNLRNTYFRMNSRSIEECKHGMFKSLVYVLAFFHAVVQERRKYGKIGWNIAYDFNESDFTVSLQILQTYLNKAIENKDIRLPWGSLKYLIGEVMYGGRVIDDFDRRIVKTYMDEYMGDFLFDEFQPFHFYRDSTVDYIIPRDGDRDSYIYSIDDLPFENSPMVFGLHGNAEIGYYSEAVKNMWAHMIDLQPQVAEAGGAQTRDKFIDGTAQDILNKLPQLYEVDVLRKKYGLTPAPTTIVLLQEIERFNFLISKIRSTLKDLRRALAGEVGFNAVLENVSSSLYNGLVPDSWLKLAPATKKPLGSWINHFLKRLAQYETWINASEPKVIWLSGLHVPESYLTALVQAACRRYNWPLDKSTLYTQVTEMVDASKVTEKPNQGCYVGGLYLEGASWDLERNCLGRSKPKILVEELPILTIIPIEANKLKLQNTYRSPVYTTSMRRNAMGVGLVFEADLRSLDHNSHWVLQGVCLTLNSDD